VLAVLLTVGFFLLDTVTPLGVAAGVPYVAVILVSLRLPSSREVWLFALGCSALTLAGIALSPGPGGAEWWKVLANRALALFVIWATAAVGIQRRRVQAALRESREARQAREREHAISLAESQARLSGVIQSAMDGIVTFDEDLRIVVFNRAAEQLFGATAAEVIGEPVARFLPERIRSQQPDFLARFAESGESSRRLGDAGGIFGLRSDGTEFPIEPMEEASYPPTGFWGDGASVAIQVIPVPVGEHRVRVEIGDSLDPEEWSYASEEKLAFSEDARRVVTFDRIAGFAWE
jgi:PAS domain S-box-containing protein